MSIFFIALRYLTSKKYKFLPSFSVFLAFFGVFLSVAVLILVLSVMNGFKVDFEKLIIGTRPHITIYPEGKSFESVKKTISNVEKLQNKLKIETTAEGVTNGQGVLVFEEKTSGVMIKGVGEQYFSRKTLKNTIVEGKMQAGEIVIGIEIAKTLGVNVGDEITILSSKMRKTLFGEMPIHKSYKVSGFFKVDMYAYDSTMVFMDVQSANALVGNLNFDDANAIEVVLQKPNLMEELYEEMVQNPLFARNYITNWKNDNQSFIDAIATQTAVMFLILSLFLIISSFITFSMLSSVANEKRRSIAILQSFGYSAGDVVKIFITFGALIVLPAIALGAFFGCIVAMNIENIKNILEQASGANIFDGAYYFLSYIPSEIHYGSVVKVCAFSLVLSMFSVGIPALRSGRILPHESLRFE